MAKEHSWRPRTELCLVMRQNERETAWNEDFLHLCRSWREKVSCAYLSCLTLGVRQILINRLFLMHPFAGSPLPVRIPRCHS